MTEPPQRAQIIIDVEFDGSNVHLSITARPLVSTHAMAQIFESCAAELRSGNLQSVKIQTLQED